MKIWGVKFSRSDWNRKRVRNENDNLHITTCTLNSECFSFFCCVLLFFRKWPLCMYGCCELCVRERVFGYTMINRLLRLFHHRHQASSSSSSCETYCFDMDVLVLLGYCFDNALATVQVQPHNDTLRCERMTTCKRKIRKTAINVFSKRRQRRRQTYRRIWQLKSLSHCLCPTHAHKRSRPFIHEVRIRAHTKANGTVKWDYALLFFRVDCKTCNYSPKEHIGLGLFHTIKW